MTGMRLFCKGCSGETKTPLLFLYYYTEAMDLIAKMECPGCKEEFYYSTTEIWAELLNTALVKGPKGVQ